ncbi:class I SAM-dependent methyltransferase [Winogradskyella immobilis]|uniref:Class I SAM-dependent methyltransferase n=1 Tax=Winogradskyella immobilis TaxID=2816852 RepID=A0ABS8EJS9_9FLAO|nr:class I SAM-dependent methyltransferase [Winogradskyella immobilis]MCC1483458.1 class I SAM-dependent methyltransferase [Winogradskyella immobilis]MCG0015552.1 class I SAM-dependent methyltransferase [Winogradskyella immobilis]
MNKKGIYLKVKDHSVSKETFDLVYNTHEDILETQPQPHPDKLSEYYKNEDYISHTDAKRNLLENLYHFVRSIALKRKLKLINSFKTEGKNLLDIGCGTGDFLQTTKTDNWNVTGIEPNAEARKIANTKTENSVFDSSKLLELESNNFDVITLWHVLEHLPNLEEHLKAFNRLLKADGYLVIAVPNYKSFDAKYYKSFWAAYDVPRHLWHFSQTGIKRLIENFGFRFQKTLPMVFDSYYVSLLSEKYKRGYMNPFMSFWIGLQSNFKARRSGEYSSLIYIFKKS